MWGTVPYLFFVPLIILLILTSVNLKDIVQGILFIISHYLNAMILSALLFPYIFGTININSFNINSLLYQSLPLLSAEFIVSIIITIVVIVIYYLEIKTILS